MKRYKITETVEYEVEAESREDAEDLICDWGPEISVEAPVKLLGIVGGRTYEEISDAS